MKKLFSKPEWLLVIVTSLGYFCDVYDILLFSAVRKASLIAIGVPETELANVGLSLLNWQLAGMLVGGLFWGVFADKRGRMVVLFGSIIAYSVATFANAFVSSVGMYAVMRFVAGVGLAGELGVGVTLISEVLEKHKRSYGVAILASFGMLGGVVAALVASKMTWQTSYMVGGVMGLALLLFRVSVADSEMFKKVYASSIGKGNILQLLGNKSLLVKYILCVLVGAPTYVFAGTFITLAPEFGTKLGLSEPPSAATALLYFYVCLTIFDGISGLLSKKLQSRKKTLYIFLALQIFAVIAYLFIPFETANGFYIRCGLIGAAMGYWTIVCVNAAEQFGINLRATVATSVPNFARGLQIPFSFLYKSLAVSLGIIKAGAFVSIASVLVALVAVFLLKERFENDLDFVENEN
ncbi:MFS transporter [Runella sp. SP2]|uniref:MFS transporter n=1 Tax=Runella sp. SP2 TaxID=2268026 RepID=UPI000F082D52|nr:MFS transporter [Runella sp. SP2]AYQ31027.1 MFS transporter [Runella sp. SP2]